MVSFTLFPTALGACGIAWRGEVVVATHLPETTEQETAARLRARASAAQEGEPPPAIGRAVAAITALLAGEPADLDAIVCDMSPLDDLSARTYAATRRIPPGRTRTYGEIAKEIGDRRLAQAVGRALGRNPFPIVVPCHRVVGADGRLTGFSASGGMETKLRMLAIEGARLGPGPGLFENLPLALKPRA